MLLRRITDYILQSRVHAMSAALALTLIPFGGTVSVLIAALVTLCQGALEGALVSVVATVPYLVYTLFPDKNQPLLVMSLLAVMIVSNVLTWAFAVLLRRYNNWNRVIELAALLSILIVATIHIEYPGVADWWGTQFTAYFTKSLPLIDSVKPDALPSDVQAQLVMFAKNYATGFAVVVVLLNIILQVLIARWWQAAMFNPGGLRKELYQIRLGYVAGIVFVCGLVLSAIGNNTVLDIMPILYTTFCVAGLSLLHNLVQLTKAAWVWLALVYAVLVWVFPYSVVIIAILGLLDTGIDFRKRFVHKSSSN